jgi:hypothetical protein
MWLDSFTGPLFAIGYVIILFSFIVLVVKTKGNILAEQKTPHEITEEIYKTCKYVVRIKAGIGYREDISIMKDWLRKNTRGRSYVSVDENKDRSITLTFRFEKKLEAARFKLEWYRKEEKIY